jgi:hypothetical protein
MNGVGKRGRRGLTIAALGAVASVTVAATAAGATPVCTDLPRTACGGRIIPEPMQTAGFLTYAEWIAAMQTLAREHPDRVRVRDVGRTAGNRPLYTVMVSDFSSPVPLRDRAGLFFNGDIHGDERDGTEGFARVTEDLATTADATVLDQLRHEVLVFTDVNPDGWQIGDVPDGVTAAGGPVYTRQNSAGHDLNREWPIVGYQNPDTFPMVDPEVRAIVREGQRLTRDEGIRFRYAFDVHGSAGAETPPAAQLMLDVLLDAGQLDLEHSLLQTEWATTYMARLRATTNDNVLARAGAATNEMLYKVGDWDTSWDIYGYTVSGGFSDWMADDVTGLDAVGGTIELWINGEPGQENTFLGYNQLIEASNVHSMRVAVQTAMDLARKERSVDLQLPKIAYIANRASVSGRTPNQLPSLFRDAPASTNRFFTDLTRFNPGVTRLDAAAVHTTNALSGFAAVVVAQDGHGDDPQFLRALHDYAATGGTVVLTDAALQDLAPLGIVPADAVGSTKVYAGFVDATASDPLAKGIRPLGRQTYEPVPIGYAISNSFSSSSSISTSPAWWVKRTAWEGAGGRTAGTTGTGFVSLGEVKLGAGRVRVLGSLLPDPSVAANHPFGTADYAVTYAGYQLFLNVVGATAALRDGPASVANAPSSTAPPSVRGARSARLPATGASTGPGVAGAILLALGLMTARSRATRRRRPTGPGCP